MSSEARRKRGRPPKQMGLGSQPALNADLLVNSALMAFSEKGFDGASLRAIAAGADVDVALIAYRYGSKLDLWKAVIDSFASEVMASVATLDRLPQVPPSNAERLRMTLDLLVDVLFDKPQLALFLVKEAGEIDRGERFDYLYRQLVEPIHAIVLPLIREVQAETRCVDPDAEILFLTLISAMSLMITNREFIARRNPIAADGDQYRAELKKSVFAGFCTRMGPRGGDA